MTGALKVKGKLAAAKPLPTSPPIHKLRGHSDRREESHKFAYYTHYQSFCDIFSRNLNALTLPYPAFQAELGTFVRHRSLTCGYENEAFQAC
jgi:hypothetical protein